MVDGNDFFCITAVDGSTVWFRSSSNRQYTQRGCTNLIGGVWCAIIGQTDITGSGGIDSLVDPAPTNSASYYRVQVEVP